MTGWTAHDIPDQSGRTAVVTGANSGLGEVTARELARRGAKVVMACRNEARGRAAERRVRESVPGADVRFAPLDLANLASVRDFAASFPDHAGGADRLDLLINNAGVMALPARRTVDGFEMQFGTNHLGHFALTGLLLPNLLATRAGARVVTLSSGFHFLGCVDPRDLNMEHRYRRWIAYGRSKSANLLFTHELARRLTAAGTDMLSVAAHPGYAATNLQTAGIRMEGRATAERMVEAVNGIVAQSPEGGALPTLYAATAPGVVQDGFYGPRNQLRGAPGRSLRARWTLNDTTSAGLWAVSERLTGVSYGLGTG
ncbi:oxidoreductase [Streptomyces sp. NPDC057654]|uniref:oxidoreductase n=1 Tax=Streptomyces sp. NPDC057654 TaxID=3346196 RepID=UPI00369DB4F2